MNAALFLGIYTVIIAGIMLGNYRWQRAQARMVRIASNYPPPPPACTQAEIDACWLDAWPSEVDEAALMNREFESMISAAWYWSPEDAQ
jgi:hypothetical protein